MTGQELTQTGLFQDDYVGNELIGITNQASVSLVA